jgi:tetratricopeptide (TPR) repeat protein
VKTTHIAMFAVTFAALAGTQSVARSTQDDPPQLSAQQHFEAGHYDEAVAALESEDEQASISAEDRYLASLALVRKSPPELDRARAELDAISRDERDKQGESEAWQAIATSARALLNGNTREAIEAGTTATMAAPDLFAAHYQLGLARAQAPDWAATAQSFERATQLDPTFAYAHYYAGLAYSRLRRSDLEAQHFQTFVKLAPDAPERLAVESILRTLRGR